MNETYENLPPELKVLADKYSEPYDDGYDYNRDFQLFFRYEKEVKGMTGRSLFSLSCNGNYVYYQSLSSSYSKNLQSSPTGGVFF